ncbi:metallophosphoesterase [Desulfobacterota bacterium AH_259_B03_O07]|nr:metallophosphoesterase [Desulfobacterota bacterium AH_259_B03_O07]
MNNGAVGLNIDKVSIDTDTKRKNTDKTTIIHISDLHIKSSTDLDKEHRYKNLSFVIKDLKKTADILVCTGDLIDNPLEESFDEGNVEKAMQIAQRFLKMLCQNCDLNPETSLFIIPGNHDYRVLGNITGSAWRKDIFTWDRDPRSDRELFSEFFNNYFKHCALIDHKIIIYCFDSNREHPIINLASGEVDQNAFTHFNDCFRQLKEQLSDNFYEFYKVVLLHHHPMPVWRTENWEDVPEKILGLYRNVFTGLIDWQGFSVLRNAGTFLNEIAREEVDLVLHGHKHEINKCRASYPHEGRYHNTNIIGAGSVGKKCAGKYSYNVITIYNDGSIYLDEKELYAGNYPRIGPSNPIVDYEEARKIKFKKLSRNSNIKVAGKLLSYMVETEPSTDLKRWIYYNGLIPLKAEYINEWIEEPVTGMKAGFEKPVIECLNETNRKPNQEFLNDNSENSPVKITFDGRLEKEKPLDIQRYRYVFGGVTFYKQDCVDVSGSEQESVGKTMMGAFESLQLTVMPTRKFPIINPRIEALRIVDIDPLKVLNSELEKDDKETEYCQKKLYWNKQAHTAVFTVDYPLPGYFYKIKWDLPDWWKALGHRNDFNEKDLVNAFDIENELRKIRKSDNLQKDITKCFKKLQKLISEDNELGFNINREEISIMVFNRENKKLEVVAGMNFEGRDLIGWGLKKGEGIEGLALLRRSFIISDTRTSFYERIRKEPSMEPHAKKYIFVTATPLFFPINTKREIAILRICSTSKNSGLEYLYDKEKRKKYIGIVVEKWVEENLLPSLRVDPNKNRYYIKQGINNI